MPIRKAMLCAAVILVGLTYIAWGEGDMSPTSLTNSGDKIRPSLLPILVKRPPGEPGFEIVATGFFIHECGWIATASHVAKTSDLYTMFEDKIFRCSVVVPQFSLGTYVNDPSRSETFDWDVAVLKIDGAKGPFPTAKLSGKTDFTPGEPAAVYGYYDRGAKYALGDQKRIAVLLTSGIISASFPIWTDEKKLGSRLVLDITAGPGSSGSPAFDPESGEVIGIVSQGKQTLVLSPAAKPGAVEVSRVPMGIAETEPIIQLSEWLSKSTPTTEHK